MIRHIRRGPPTDRVFAYADRALITTHDAISGDQHTTALAVAGAKVKFLANRRLKMVHFDGRYSFVQMFPWGYDRVTLYGVHSDPEIDFGKILRAARRKSR